MKLKLFCHCMLLVSFTVASYNATLSSQKLIPLVAFSVLNKDHYKHLKDHHMRENGKESQVQADLPFEEKPTMQHQKQ